MCIRDRIDINKAELWELQALRGIGEKRAKDIAEYREKNGPFRTVDDLCAVSGIGPKTLDRLRAHLAVRAPEDADGKAK